jgi:hypothetical protein
MINFLTAILMFAALPVAISIVYIAFVIIRKGAAWAWKKAKHEYLMTPKTVYYRMEGL